MQTPGAPCDSVAPGPPLARVPVAQHRALGPHVLTRRTRAGCGRGSQSRLAPWAATGGCSPASTAPPRSRVGGVACGVGRPFDSGLQAGSQVLTPCFGPQTRTTSTSSRRTPASWAWWCAEAPPWCSSARRTAWRPSPTPSSSSRRPSRRRQGRPPWDSQWPPEERDFVFLYRLHFCFLNKIANSRVGSHGTLLSASVFWVTGVRFSPAESSSASSGLCWGLGGDDRAVPGGGQGAQLAHPGPACGSGRVDQPPAAWAADPAAFCPFSASVWPHVASQRTRRTSLGLSPACPPPAQGSSALPTPGPGSPTPSPFRSVVVNARP